MSFDRRVFHKADHEFPVFLIQVKILKESELFVFFINNFINFLVVVNFPLRFSESNRYILLIL